MNSPKRLSLVLGLIAALSLPSACTSTNSGSTDSNGAMADAHAVPAATGPEAHPAVAGTGCQLLNVYVTNAQGTNVSVPNNGVACEHGYYVRSTPSQDSVQYVTNEQSTVYGPDCNITFNANNQVYVVRAQQNYCYLAAGNITASVVSGNAVITSTQRGGYPSTPGTVNVTLR